MQLPRSFSLILLLSLSSLVAVLAASSGSSAASRLSRAGLRPEGTQGDQTNQASAAQQADQTDQAFQSYQAAVSAAIIEAVNSHPNATWTAGVSDYFDGKSFDFLKQSCGMKFPDSTKLSASSASSAAAGSSPSPQANYPFPVAPISSALPESFDAREKWGATCASLYDIRDQAGCGSCWAVAAAEAMTDRHCIASNGAKQPYLSAHHILTCCGLQECGSCEGGYPINAWQYWVNSGVVTGGSFGSTGTCQPYAWAPCEHHTEGTRPKCVAQDSTPQCANQCSQPGLAFHEDKSFGGSAYKVAENEEAIMTEILNFGPVEAGFMVYEDFPAYRSGVYRHVAGNMVGGHAIKILGWGVEAGQKYWLAANSWNTNWGDNGYFKIARGTGECFIEDMMFAGQVRQ